MIIGIGNKYLRRFLTVIWFVLYLISAFINIIADSLLYLLDCLGFSNFEGSFSDISSNTKAQIHIARLGAAELWRGV